MKRNSSIANQRLARIGIVVCLLIALLGASVNRTAQAAFGGPDAFGYYYEDFSGVTFEDMSGASALSLGDSGLSAPQPMGFGFSFYGTTYTSVYVCANGVLQFEKSASSTTCDYLARPIPTTDDAYPMIAAWWGDLDQTYQGTVKAKTFGTAPNQVFVVEFANVPHFLGSDPVTFQIKLFQANNAIEIHYQDAPASNANQPGPINHTVGIQKDATVGLQYFYNTTALPGTPKTVRFFLDGAAPETTITGKPSDPSNVSGPTFSFSGTDADGAGVASYECKLDEAAFSACTSPKDYPSQADGSHTFQVRAIDRLGKVDPTPATYTWVIDSNPPDTSISLPRPTDPTNAKTASFTFSGNDGNGTGVASFECQMDGKGFSGCTSPKDYSSLADGSHTFQVRAIDHMGYTDATPASYTWTVDATAPAVPNPALPEDGKPVKGTNVSLKWQASAGASGYLVKIDGGPAVDVHNVLKMDTTQTRGAHTWSVAAYDSVGNTSAFSSQWTFIVVTPEMYLPVINR